MDQQKEDTEFDTDAEARLLGDEPMEVDEVKSSDEAQASLQAQKELEENIHADKSPPKEPKNQRIQRRSYSRS